MQKNALQIFFSYSIQKLKKFLKETHVEYIFVLNKFFESIVSKVTLMVHHHNYLEYYYTNLLNNNSFTILVITFNINLYKLMHT